jgi:hypothetical protein
VKRWISLLEAHNMSVMSKKEARQAQFAQPGSSIRGNKKDGEPTSIIKQD